MGNLKVKTLNKTCSVHTYMKAINITNVPYTCSTVIFDRLLWPKIYFGPQIT